MARYIDAEKLITHLKDEIEGVKTPMGGRAQGKTLAYGTALGLKMAISFAETLPEEDVVLRAEVNKIFHEIFEIIKKYEHDALAAKENYGVFQVRNFGCDIMKLREKYGITDNTRKE